ncbi:hypothetical protein D9M69_626110 [compost metagenome]
MLGFVEHAVLELLAAWREALGLREPELFLKELDAIVQLGNVLSIGSSPRFEFADIGLGGRRQLREVVLIHAEHDSAATAQSGIRHATQPSSRMLIFARRVPLHGIHVDTVQ